MTGRDLRMLWDSLTPEPGPGPEVEPTCDLCGEPPCDLDACYCAGWNGETGCHVACEAPPSHARARNGPTVADYSPTYRRDMREAGRHL